MVFLLRSFSAGLSLVALVSCNMSPEQVKFKQYYRKGQALYALHCSNCHQQDGSGLRQLYPPLDSSDYMTHRRDEVICLIRNGKSGEIVVNEKRFNQQMPAFTSLSNLEVAQIATYIYNTWSHNDGLIDVNHADSVLSRCE